MLMSLDRELATDIGMKYLSTYVLDENNQPVYFRDYGGGPNALVVTENREGISKPLSELFAPVFPWGFCNNLSGSNFLHFQRTAARTVKKGICDNTVRCNTSLNHKVIRAALAPSFSTWNRLKDGESKGALSSVFAVNGSSLIDLAGKRIASIINEHIIIKTNLDNNYHQWLQRELERVVGEGVIVDGDDETVILDEMFTTPSSAFHQSRQNVRFDDTSETAILERMRTRLNGMMYDDEELEDEVI